MKGISAKDLSKSYCYYEKEAGFSGSLRALFKGRKVVVEAVRQINLEVEVGELIGFIGPNGAGKTTTLKMLSGILYPTEGDVKVMGFTPSKREKAFLRSITFVMGQRDRLFWDLPAEEYFNFCKVVYEIPDDRYRRNLTNLIEMAEIGSLLKVPQRKLSLGQRKRCELVAALLHDPQVVFLDEPTNALDLISARKIREFIKSEGKQGRRTIVLTSHNMLDIGQVCDRVVIINCGKIVYDGHIQNLARMDGIKKEMKIAFNGPWEGDAIARMAKIVKQDDHELLLEVDPAQTARLAAFVFARFPVLDIEIKDPPLEKIIESIYRKQDG
jgi:ABC-2 type transport system ATP-binding protein